MKKFFSVIFLFFSMLALNAKIRLPAVLGDNMVLQRNTEVNLWGKADPQKAVTVTTSWNKRTYTAKSDSRGDWSLKVKTLSAGGPYTVSFSDGTPLKVSNVLIGEVWICSGQSNMEMPVKGFIGQPVKGSADAIATADPTDGIRLINLKTNSSQTPLDDCISTPWQESDPESVSNFSATAYFFGTYLRKTLKVPVGLICSCWGGSKIQSWINKETYENSFSEISLDVLKKDPKEIKIPKNEPTLLYNAMIYPIERYTVRGAIWYQGESNLGEAPLYEKLFPAMVASWRKEWKEGDFPFYYVQIAPYCYGKDNCDKLDAAEIRQVQLECLKLIPKSGMAVTLDIGNRDYIHAPNKMEVGKRLALCALANTYGRKGTPFSGPIVKTMEVNRNKVTVTFDYAELGLYSPNENLSGFELAGSDGIYYPAEARFVDKKTKVEVSSDNVGNPVSLRYAYHNYAEAGLFNNYGLPASPFIIKNIANY